MRRLLAILLLTLAVAAGVTAAAQQRLSARTRAHVGSLDDNEPVQAFVTCRSVECLRGVQVNMLFDSTAVITVPAGRLRQVAARAGVRQVALPAVLTHQTDSSRAATRVDEVLRGAGLPRGYDGSGVVLGVIDTGIDFNHLAFRDADGKSRIERVYRPTLVGGRQVIVDGDTLPGSQFFGPDEVLALTTDDATMTHGTHTMGIAGGSRVDKYSGMAPGARLVCVAIPGDSLTTARLLLGARYIADYARQLGLPCVISISMGDHVGSHDGTSPAARGFDAIARQTGATIVISAGNEGSRPLHLRKHFDPAVGEEGARVATVMRTTPGLGAAEVDAWSADATPFSLELQLYDAQGRSVRLATQPIMSDTLICLDDDPDMNPYVTGTVQVCCEVDPVNGRFHIYSVFDTRMKNSLDFWTHVYHCGTVATLDAWNVDNRSQFERMGRTDCQAGDAEYSINDLATGLMTVAVGNHSARDHYTTAGGTSYFTPTPAGQISPTSSYGTLPDGRALPHVAAPGVAVISSVSRYSNRLTWCYGQTDAAGVEHRWTNMSGTSMAAPCVAGIVALWLQASPTLTPGQVQEIIAETAGTDDYTALAPARWGAGKINAYRGLLLARRLAGATAGDVNGDGQVDVADINMVINVMLGREAETVMPEWADVSGDGHVDVSDINMIINLMLNKQ